MVVISYSHAFKSLGLYIENYNSDVDYKDRVKSSVLLTAEKLIRIYGVALVKANQVQPVDAGNLPALRTNSVQLAKSAKCSVRTIRRHINRLMAAKIIVKKVFHGSNADFELWLNPAIIRPMDRLTPVVELPPQMQGRKPEGSHATITDAGTTCPHTDTGYYTDVNKLINTVSSVDNQRQKHGNSGSRRSSLSRTSVEFTGNSTGNQKTGDTRKVVHRRGEDSRETTLDSSRCTTLSFFVERLWDFSRSILYTDTYLSKWQHQQAKRLLLAWYEPVPDKSLAAVHEQYCERVRLAKRFVDQMPHKRFIPLPHIYFNHENPHGFTGTKAWLKVEHSRKRTVAEKRIVKAQVRKYQSNLKKGTGPVLSVFKECEQKVKELGSPELLDEFYRLIGQPTDRLP